MPPAPPLASQQPHSRQTSADKAGACLPAEASAGAARPRGAFRSSQHGKTVGVARRPPQALPPKHCVQLRTAPVVRRSPTKAGCDVALRRHCRPGRRGELCTHCADRCWSGRT